jgi:hypothetical protein
MQPFVLMLGVFKEMSLGKSLKQSDGTTPQIQQMAELLWVL